MVFNLNKTKFIKFKNILVIYSLFTISIRYELKEEANNL